VDFSEAPVLRTEDFSKAPELLKYAFLRAPGTSQKRRLPQRATRTWKAPETSQIWDYSIQTSHKAEDFSEAAGLLRG
jgi:hypothetical protein